MRTGTFLSTALLISCLAFSGPVVTAQTVTAMNGITAGADLTATMIFNQGGQDLLQYRIQQVAGRDVYNTDSDFVAGSTAFTNYGNYPKLYTCDSTGISPTLHWAGAPAGTTCYAITMHHIPPDGGRHVYFVLYDIPASVRMIPDAVADFGTFGINTVNGQNKYAPPCSKGPGPKLYTITVYALSSAPGITVPSSQLTMDVLLNAIIGKTLATSVINVTYAREKSSK